jgi:hypothetical protein
MSSDAYAERRAREDGTPERTAPQRRPPPAPPEPVRLAEPDEAPNTTIDPDTIELGLTRINQIRAQLRARQENP